MSVDNILAIYDLASRNDRLEGKGWYPYALSECSALADRYEIDRQRVVWATAALSPQLKWERNIRATRLVLEGWPKVAGVYPINVEKAWRIVYDGNLDVLNGPKVQSFARCIWGDPESVCVDTWAWRVWAGADLWAKPPSLDRVYDAIAEDYRTAARVIGLEPRQVQAITWVSFRRIANGHAFPGQLSLDI